MNIDPVDSRLLEMLQSEFPVDQFPFSRMAQVLGTDESEILSRVRALENNGIIREISAVFSPSHLGYRTTLCAARVEPGRIEEVANEINLYSEVTHNYERDNALNLWFALVARSQERVDKIVEATVGLPGVLQAFLLPAKRKFKIHVHFPFKRSISQHESQQVEKCASLKNADVPIGPREFSVLELDLLRALQQDLPLLPQPFAELTASLPLSEKQALTLIERWISDGTIRRYGARVRHRKLGYQANAMTVWKVDETEVDSMARLICSHAEVSHCYLREIRPEWQYGLYTMIHARTRQEILKVIESLAAQTGLTEYQMLFTTKEHKKSSPKYFIES